MNFFEAQEKAKKNTFLLVFLLLCAVAGLIALTVLAIILLLAATNSGGGANVVSYGSVSRVLTWELVAGISAVVISVVIIGSLYRWVQLSRGGRTVAEAMGGRLISIDTRDFHEKQLLNIVEEMSIASGVPVPQVFAIDDSSINAFAAGNSHNDAVIGVTKGCMKLLQRNELQAVVAHEFSHIFHGDMKLNMKLIGVLHGILVIGSIGSLLLHSRRRRYYRGTSKNDSGAALFALGLVFVIIGYCGTFFGNLIKAAVSRQREFLADASAVQYTRDASGISGALQAIGGYYAGSEISSTNASEFSHMFFAQGVRTFFSGLMATHPPLATRIYRIDRDWDGQFRKRDDAVVNKSGSVESQNNDRSNRDGPLIAVASATVAAATIDKAIEDIGKTSSESLQRAGDLIDAIPESLRRAAHEPYSARPLIYVMLMAQTDIQYANENQQWTYLEGNTDSNTLAEAERLYKTVLKLARSQYLPLLELTLPTIKQLNQNELEALKRIMVGLIKIDKKISLFEWSLYGMVTHYLKREHTYGKKSLKQLAQPLTYLLIWLLSQNNKHGDDDKVQALNQILHQVGQPEVRRIDTKTMQEADQALHALKHLRPLQKPILLKSIRACFEIDGIISITEAEIFRAIAMRLDCPVEPLVSTEALVVHR